jgi:hypothetical protein
MRRHVMPGLLALVASTIFVQASTPAAPAKQPQPFRKLEFSRIGAWEVAAIGNDEKVNHCALTRGTSSADLKAGEPKFTMIVDTTYMIVRVRDASFRFTERKGLAVTAVTAEGVESKPAAATGGPDLADIRFASTERDALFASKHVDIKLEDSTVRLSFAGLTEAKADFDKCMANIGSPAKGFGNGEMDQLVEKVKRGKATCTENKRTRVTTCDVDE